MRRSACTSGVMTPGTFASYLSPLPADTYTEASPNGTWHMCSQRACPEHCQSHSARGHVSGGHPSFMWPLAVARCPGRLCLWSYPDLLLVSSWRNLQI